MAKKRAPQRTIPVSRRALIQRINRRLSDDGEMLKAIRSERWRHELGDYHTIDIPTNSISRKHVDLEALGRELGALQKFEHLAD